MISANDKIIAELRTENDKLKGILANSDIDCIYCGLPSADLVKCALGFPGCERAEDMLAVMDFTGLEIPDATAATEYATDIASMYTVNDTDIASMYTVNDTDVSSVAIYNTYTGPTSVMASRKGPLPLEYHIIQTDSDTDDMFRSK